MDGKCNAELAKEMLEQLSKLTRKMDLPEFKRTSVVWLSKNMAVRNSTHVAFPKAKELVESLMRMGVRS